MNLNELLQIAGAIVVLGVALGAGTGGFLYALRTKTGKIQKEQIEQLQKDNEVCTQNYNNLKAEFHELKGTVATLRDVPLQEIRDGIKSLGDNGEKNRRANENVVKVSGRILDTLKNSAVILANDTTDAKAAVRKVKRDLEAA